jgi:NAD-dependent deacetylase
VSVERLAELVESRQPCVVLTGAGISTESGIPDFRSAQGIWKRFDPMEYAHIDAFLADPVKVWDFYGKRLDALGEAEPNDGHRALAALEERGWIEGVVTQNVDGLHARAGARELVEVHGSLRTVRCLHCGTRTPTAEVAHELPPRCPACGEIPKPDVVMFGEWLPEAALRRARELAAHAGLLLVVGSSLEVHPIASLPEDTLAGGGELAIVNRGGTPWDPHATLVVDAGAGETLSALAERLRSRVGGE